MVAVKDKAQSKDKWDIFDIVSAVPGPNESLELIQPTRRRIRARWLSAHPTRVS